jgi:hypothetical protein
LSAKLQIAKANSSLIFSGNAWSCRRKDWFRSLWWRRAGNANIFIKMVRGWWSGNLSSCSFQYNEYSPQNILSDISRQEQVAQMTNVPLIVQDRLLDGGVGDEHDFLLNELGGPDDVKDCCGGVGIPFNKDALNL